MMTSMTKHNLIRGIAIGVVAGATIGAIAMPKGSNAKRRAEKFLRAAGDILEDVTSIWH